MDSPPSLPPIHLDLVAKGTRDVAVGISGFGSANVPATRWMPLSVFTGRTVFALSYPAQELPSILTPELYVSLLARRWKEARSGAEEAAAALSSGVSRWISEGRRVLLVGFSLGGWISWEVASRIASPLIDVVLISAACKDNHDTWSTLPRIGRLVNVYTDSDAVLKYLFPLGSREEPGPAAGLGPLCVTAPNLSEVDATALVGRKHVVDQRQLNTLLALSLSMLSTGARPRVLSLDRAGAPTTMSMDQVTFLSSWMVGDYLWGLLSQALSGDRDSIVICVELSNWGMQVPWRKDALVEMGQAWHRLSESASMPHAKDSMRQIAELIEGVVRRYGPLSGT